jgi:CBS domain-containing protein
LTRVAASDGSDGRDLRSIVRDRPTVAYPDEPLRVIVHRMAETGITRFPVVERGPSRRIVGMISLEDLLKARTVNLEAERRRETVRRVRVAFPFGRKPAGSAT